MKIWQKLFCHPPIYDHPQQYLPTPPVLSRQLPSLVTVNLLYTQDQSKRKLSSLNNSKILSMLKALMEAIKIDYLLRAISQS